MSTLKGVKCYSFKLCDRLIEKNYFEGQETGVIEIHCKFHVLECLYSTCLPQQHQGCVIRAPVDCVAVVRE